MVNQKTPRLDLVFAALSDSTRRGVLAQLEGGSSSVTELSQAHDLSLPGFMKHLAVLEAAGLISRAKAGRVVRCELDAAPMQEAAAWITRYERFWTAQLDALGNYLDQQEDMTAWNKANTTSRTGSRSAAATPSPPKKSGARGPSRKR